MKCRNCTEEIQPWYVTVGNRTYQYTHVLTNSPFCGHPPVAQPEIVVPEKCSCPNCVFIQDITSGARP